MLTCLACSCLVETLSSRGPEMIEESQLMSAPREKSPPPLFLFSQRPPVAFLFCLLWVGAPRRREGFPLIASAFAGEAGAGETRKRNRQK